jgi:Mg2+ and Co2+ transporter CorA
MFFEVVESAPVQNAQSELERFVRTTEEFSETVKRLPTQVTEERTAAVQQLLQGLATQCTNVMTQLCSEEDKLQSSMRELRMTFTAGSEMASSVNAASRSLIAFTELVQPKQSSRTNRTNSHPFDIREYGETARDIGLSADQLTTLLRSLKESSPQFTELISHMQRESHSWVNYAIEKILLLTLCIVVLTFTASLWRRCLLDRSSTKHTRSSET